MVRSMTKRGMPKPFAIIVAALLALYFVPLNALPAAANVAGNKLVGGFEIDGNLYPGAEPGMAAGVDWTSAEAQPQPAVVDVIGGGDTTVFSNGSKENDPPTSWQRNTSAGASGKTDVGNIYVHSRLSGGDQYAYLGFERDTDNGTVFYVIELNQKPNTTTGGANPISVPVRSVGDLRVTLAQQGGGSFTLSAEVATWTGSAWSAAIPVPAGSVYGLVNDQAITPGPWGSSVALSGGKIGSDQFVELALNLTALGVDLQCPSTGFNALNLRSRSSQSESSQMKDYATGPINVPSNCSQLKIEKRKGNATGDLLSGATFAISPNPLPGQILPDPLIVTDGGTNDADGAANGTVLINPAKPGTYSVTEVTPPLGYIKEDGSKPVTAEPYAKVPAVLVFTNDLGKAEWEKRDATTGELVCCATFHVEGIGGAAKSRGYDETVRDDNDANTAVESGTTVDDRNDAAGKIRLNDLYTGTYRVTEVSAPGGYELSAPSVKTFVIDSTTLNTTLTGTAANTGTTGAFLDTRLTPDVSVVKRDTNANGGTLAGATFELFYDNGTKGTLDGADISVTGHGTNPQVSGANGLATWTDLAWGDYLVVEQQAPAGYQLPAPKPVQAFSVTRANADDNSRVFTFTDPRKPSAITVTKKDTQGNVVTTYPAKFGLYVDTNNDGVHQDGEPQVPGTPELNPQWTTTDGSQGATVDGTAGWTNLDFGHYVVHEIEAPQGYGLPANLDLEVDIDAANAGGSFALEIRDPKLKTPLMVKKTDEAGDPLAGASFQLWQETNGTTGLQTAGTKDTLLGDCTTTLPGGTCTLPEGSDSFEITWPNTYYWFETAPPSGYSLPGVADRVRTVVVTQANITDPFPPTVFVDPKPDIETHATAADLPEGTITDWANLTGIPADAIGKLHFKLYGPYDSDTLKGESCVNANLLVASEDVDVAGPGRYPTGTSVVSAVATKPGTYYWYVTFTSGGDLFGSAVEPCGSPNEVVTVNKAAPVITTQATKSATYLDSEHGTIQDTVVVRPVSNDATGNVVVSVWGPSQSSAPSCTGAPLESWTATRTGSPAALTYTVTSVAGKYQIDWTTPALAAPAAGYYFWKASYGGDTNNDAATHPCGEISETRYEVSHVDKAPVTVLTSATPSSLITPAGTDPVSDQVFVKYAGVKPTGTLTVNLYGPLAGEAPAQSCATSPQAHASWTLDLADGTVVTDNTGTYVALSTPNFTPTQPGTYRWAASYGGDKNYLAKDAVCPDPLEVTTVSKPELDKFADPATVATPNDGSPTLVLRGSIITYTVTVRNTGDAAISNKALVDTLPDQVSFQAVVPPTPAPTQGVDGLGHATLTWPVSLAAGASQTFVYTVKVGQAAPSGALVVNTARFLGLEDTTTHQVGVPVPTLDKSSPTDGQLVKVGDKIHYEIVVGNTGNYPITASQVVDTLPAGINYLDGTATARATGGASFVSANPTTGNFDGHGTLMWTVTIPGAAASPRPTVTFEFDATVTSAVAADATLVNTATFEQLVDRTTHHTGHATPTLDKSSPNEGATVPLGSTIHYKVRVGNTGDYPVTGRPVIDTLPDGVTYVAGSATSATTGGGTASAAPTTGTSGGHATLTWTVTLPPSATATFEFDVTVNANNPRAAELKNTAEFENLTDFTVHYVGIPNPTLDKFANPATTDASPALVQPGTRIDYSVKVGNTGNIGVTNAPVIDTLPNNVSVVAGTISDGGVLSGDNKTITWSVTLAPAASKTFTYSVTVDQAAPPGSVLVNTAKFQNLTDATTHVVPTGAMTLVKGVSPVAGNGVVVEFGDTLTYTLTASATGGLDQPNVVVTDYLPGRDPARPGSGSTTYVAGSAACIGAGTCTVGGPDANGLITWSLGDMAAGTSRQVTFQVTIDDVSGAAGETVAVDIRNAGAVQSDRTPKTPSNEVVTPITKVLPVKVSRPPQVQPETLPHTGSALPIGPTVGGALTLLGLGLLLLMLTGRRRSGLPGN